jgi:ubiquinone/menaquinone biosynthesis C-methylase UbiE
MTDPTPEIVIKKMYQRRFGGDENFRLSMWRVLCECFFQKYVPVDATVLELAAGHCEFINSIRAGRKIAVDINPETRDRAESGVEVILSSATDLSAIPDDTVDVAFTSNFLEHITREDIVTMLCECRRILKPSGKLLILQPNVRYLSRDYWMFFDHITPIDDRALQEILAAMGFEIDTVLPRFLPYTAKSRYPRSMWLIRTYLKLPILFPLFGKQAFVVARK